uniref:Uncharacterized protein n=1 Tax=Yersinia pestis subsp. pestis bv. Medievalis TaxID=1234662 RepID=A0A096ZX95_YERPE|nr:hypothetical protein [Yersinia pestis subsp. pestis bv. Medievalis]
MIFILKKRHKTRFKTIKTIKQNASLWINQQKLSDRSQN